MTGLSDTTKRNILLGAVTQHIYTRMLPNGPGTEKDFRRLAAIRISAAFFPLERAGVV
ncbi:MAG: hypothetical protein ABFS02_04640 [Pseudomonadota bacterium]